MILTPDLVFVHYPKAGGTFVTEALSRLYGERDSEFVDTGEDGMGPRHNQCVHIPDAHRHKPIVSVTRNPFERYVSQYCYRWWALHPERYCGLEKMRALYPHYPDLTFAEFLTLANTVFVAFERGQPTTYVNRKFPPGRELGWHTREFVRFFFRDPEQTYARLDEEAIDRDRLCRLMYPVRFLPLERLNDSLYELLLDLGLPPTRIDFIRSMGKVLPSNGGREEGDRWERYYTPELVELVRVRERLLFELFPQYDAVGHDTAGSDAIGRTTQHA
jgi:hypothetical protein